MLARLAIHFRARRVGRAPGGAREHNEKTAFRRLLTIHYLDPGFRRERQQYCVSDELRRYLLEREVRDIGPFTGVLDSNAANVSVAVEIKQGVFIQVLGFADLGRLEFDIKRVRVLEILNFHGLNDTRCA